MAVFARFDWLKVVVATGVVGALAMAAAWAQTSSVGGAETAPAAAAPETQPRPATASAAGLEAVVADVSTRSVAITSSFTGVEIVVFGAIENARQAAVDAEEYDIVVVVSGVRQALTTRRKTNRAGIWINTEAVTFDKVPSYYAIATTQPLDVIANAGVLNRNDIGFARITMDPKGETAEGMTTAEVDEFREAVVRLKRRERLYVNNEYGVTFVTGTLFRTTIDLPANVPVGPLNARIFLFRDQKLVDTFQTRVKLERRGLERYLHGFAYGMPMLYGIFCVLVAMIAGLTASAVVTRMRR